MIHKQTTVYLGLELETVLLKASVYSKWVVHGSSHVVSWVTKAGVDGAMIHLMKLWAQI